MIADLTKLLDYRAAAEALDCSEPTLRRLVRAKKIGHYRRGRSVRFSAAHIEADLQSIEQCPQNTNSESVVATGTSAGGTSTLTSHAAIALAKQITQPRKRNSRSGSSSSPGGN